MGAIQAGGMTMPTVLKLLALLLHMAVLQTIILIWLNVFSVENHHHQGEAITMAEQANNKAAEKLTVESSPSDSFYDAGSSHPNLDSE